MIDNITKLEKQVRIASLENRFRRHNMAVKGHLLGRAAKRTAAQPLILGAGFVVGFSFGLLEAHQCRERVVSVKRRGFMSKILSLGLSYVIHSNRFGDQDSG
tara:strand:- start:172 stop:477 length:306 start_codon:yes stop_codon:yes gene_type:complete